MNFITATLQRSDGGGLRAAVDGAGSVTVDGEHSEQLVGHLGLSVLLGIRAENIEVVRDEDASGDLLRARVLVVEPLGSHDLLTVHLGGEQIKVATRPDNDVKADDDIQLRLEYDRIIWLDPASERAVGA
jgi:multiple sugar transport system ATP-binding protein